MSGKANGSADRQHNDGSSGRAFTVEQKAAVVRIRKCKATAFYDILGLEEVRATCSDGDIKKAYRKLSLLTHPDKNGYEGADEAFKLVSRAFQILSDSDKKQRYDKFGGDPDNRFSSAGASGASPFSGFAQQRGGGRRPMYEEEISPEELFRQFFAGGLGGMGGMGGPFGGLGGFGGPGFVFNMGGGPGIRVHQFGGGAPRRRPHNHTGGPEQERGALEVLRSLLPLLLLVIIPLLSNLFSSGSSGPTIRLDKASRPHTLGRESPNLHVPYWVNPSDVKDYSEKQWTKLDRLAETEFHSALHTKCTYEENRRQQMYQQAQGLFFTDREMLQRARDMDMPACRRLNEINKGRSFFF